MIDWSKPVECTNGSIKCSPESPCLESPGSGWQLVIFGHKSSHHISYYVDVRCGQPINGLLDDRFVVRNKPSVYQKGVSLLSGLKEESVCWLPTDAMDLLLDAGLLKDD